MTEQNRIKLILKDLIHHDHITGAITLELVGHDQLQWTSGTTYGIISLTDYLEVEKRINKAIPKGSIQYKVI